MYDVFPIILLAILFIVGYVLILGRILKKATYRSPIALIAVLVLIIYGAAVASLYILSTIAGSAGMAFFILCIVISVITFFMSLKYLVTNLRYINKGALALFIIYMGVMILITVIRRFGEYDNRVEMEMFANLSAAIRHGNFSELSHSMLNVAMFIPFGILAASIPDEDPDFLSILLTAITASTIIECTQLIYRLGICDVNDIIANALGAAVGYIFWLFLRRLSIL
ncbi:MAG: VanZ family protein [Eubacteriales bacterium]|nr:VanZ family protein [Eubacteriales bacterium]